VGLSDVWSWGTKCCQFNFYLYRFSVKRAVVEPLQFAVAEQYFYE
jgi:hypothetical protein